jgi:hypothetical protein
LIYGIEVIMKIMDPVGKAIRSIMELFTDALLKGKNTLVSVLTIDPTA